MKWLTDPKKWNSLDITEKLEMLRKHYCNGPCGQSVSVTSTRSETDKALKEAIREIEYYRNYIGEGINKNE